jgi:hypothetical protein
MPIATSTLAAIAAAAAVVGTAVTSVGMYQQGKAQEKVGKYNAKIAENAAISKRYEAEAQAARIRDKAKRIRSSQVTGYSKSGVTLTGSVNDVMLDSSLASETDALTALYEGKTSGDNLHAQASLSRYEGKQARTNSYYGIGGTVLSGVIDAANYGIKANNAKAESQPTID